MRSIRVFVHGCVNVEGWVAVPPFASLRSVLRRAGGPHTGSFITPSQTITIRRRGRNGRYSYTHANLRSPRALLVRDGDAVKFWYGLRLRRWASRNRNG